MPVSFAMEPAAHRVGSEAPRPQAWPTGQAVQFACATSPVAFPNVPSAHASALALMLPAGQKKPRVHAPEHAASDSPVSLPYRPAGQSVDSDALPAQKPPRLQGRGCAAPPTHMLPAGQPTHVSSVTLRYVPGSHDAGICTTEPSGQRKPASHTTHAVAPSPAWKVPAAQAEQSWLAPPAAYVPLAHTVASVAPKLHAWPGGQAWQSSCDVSPVTLPKLPPSQGRSMLLRVPQ